MVTVLTRPSSEFLALLHADMELPHNRYLNSPLLQAIDAGVLPREAIKDFALWRWPFQAHADLAMMLAHSSFLEARDAAHLLSNAYDEILRPKGEGDHPSLWWRFARACGATDEELHAAAAHPLPEVAGFPNTLREFATRSAEEGLAAWYADEEQLPEALGGLGYALRKRYGYRDEAIEYFLEHVRADVGHSDATEELLLRYCDTPERQYRARRAANVTLWAWLEMHAGILRALRRKYGF
ncbi:MAG TPA: iron-containing redox enzyme family protein [Chloroflexota bacterium]|jgi:pyrroloquinoline-quinone synthase|nr:iron-containing redox enzyme family protein [Chloroflexota bacterium]